MNSAELKLETRQHAPDSREPESRNSSDKRRPNSSILRLVRGALDGVGDERSTVEVPKDALVKVGAPFSFETAAYTMDGGVVELTVAEALSSTPDASVKPFSR